MTVALVQRAGPQDGAAADEARLDALIAHLAANRFMPVPPADVHNVGDGDFRAIGAEFLGHFVRYGALTPDESVLDIGCGVGRMALPLTQYLAQPGARYHGFDVVPGAIAWCRQAIVPVYPGFRFDHLDVAHDLYNPAGAIAPEQVRLPVAAQAFDFVIMTSVLTHLRTAEAAAYLNETARVLKPGGRCLISLFLMDGVARGALRAHPGRLGFDPAAAGPEYFADPQQPLGAVAFNSAHFIDLAAGAGLVPFRPIVPGSWSGRPGVTYQDLCVLEPRERPR